LVSGNAAVVVDANDSIDTAEDEDEDWAGRTMRSALRSMAMTMAAARGRYESTSAL
jgi:hypothetical protein